MNTKKIIFILVFLTVAFFSFSQAYDALNFSLTDPVAGTARYTGMAGAMGALGGDATAMKDNPAGMGIYRRSDITMNYTVGYASGDNLATPNRFINNFAFVLNLGNSDNEKGYITSSLGVSYNRLKNFKRYSELTTLNNPVSVTDVIPDVDYYFYKTPRDFELETVNTSIKYTEKGKIGEWNISYGLNISNIVYLGTSVGFVNLNYKQFALYEEQERWKNINGYWCLDNTYEVSGKGLNFKFGIIVAPIDFIRVGLAYHMPTLYENMDEYVLKRVNRELFYISNVSYFDIQTPSKWQGSLGFIIGKRAIVGLEYQLEDFSAIKTYYDGALDQVSKNYINSEMNITHTIKAGGEVKIIDGVSFRAGLAFVSNPSTKLPESVYSAPESFQVYPLVQPQNRFYYTGGIGYRGESFYLEMAYMHQTRKEYLFEYLPKKTGPYDVTLRSNNIILAIGFRFSTD